MELGYWRSCVKKGESDRAISEIQNRQHEKYGNELIWRYPISDGDHLGTFIVLVSKGFVSLLFDVVDNEVLILEDAVMFDEDTTQMFIDDWRSFSKDLANAMTDTLRIIRG